LVEEGRLTASHETPQRVRVSLTGSRDGRCATSSTNVLVPSTVSLRDLLD
jgi:hypothetical protein